MATVTGTIRNNSRAVHTSPNADVTEWLSTISIFAICCTDDCWEIAALKQDLKLRWKRGRNVPVIVVRQNVCLSKTAHHLLRVEGYWGVKHQRHYRLLAYYWIFWESWLSTRNAMPHNRMGNNRNMCGWAIESLTTILPRHPCYFSMAILLNKNEIRFIQQKANEAKWIICCC